MRRILLTQLHAATVFLGVVCATLGAVAIYLNKEKAGKPHFTSPHSQVGIGFVLLVLSSYASAFFNVATNGPAAVSSAKRGDGLAVTATSLSSSSPPPKLHTFMCSRISIGTQSSTRASARRASSARVRGLYWTVRGSRRLIGRSVD